MEAFGRKEKQEARLLRRLAQGGRSYSLVGKGGDGENKRAIQIDFAKGPEREIRIYGAPMWQELPQNAWKIKLHDKITVANIY